MMDKSHHSITLIHSHIISNCKLDALFEDSFKTMSTISVDDVKGKSKLNGN